MLLTGGALELPEPLVPGAVGRVHRVALGARRRDQEPARVPEGPRPLQDHLQAARRIVAHLIAEEPADGFGLQPRLRARPPRIERHPVEGEPGQGRLRHPFLDRPAGLEGRRQPVAEKVPQFVLGRRHPHGRAGVFGDGPAGAVHHGLGLGTLGGTLNGDVPDAVVGEVFHDRLHPGRGVRTPAARQGRGFIDVDVFLAPLPRRATVGGLAGRAETFHERVAGRSHVQAGTLRFDPRAVALPLARSPKPPRPRFSAVLAAVLDPIQPRKGPPVARGAVWWADAPPTSPP